MQRTLSTEDQEYLTALKKRRNALVEAGVKSYGVGSRNAVYLEYKDILAEIARLDGTTAPRFRRVIVTDR